MKNNKKKLAPVYVSKILCNEKYGEVEVISGSDGEGYINLANLCNLLSVPVEAALHKLPKETLHTFVPIGDYQRKHITSYVNEDGLYMLFLLSNEKDAILLQEWFDAEFLEALREKQKKHAETDKEANSDIDSYYYRQSLRFIANAANVLSSSRFRIEKEVPDLTRNHLIGWWHNPQDKTAFMLQFDCKNDFFWCRNIRMNVTLTKKEDGSTDACDMMVSLLDLDDANNQLFDIATEITEEMLFDGGILDNIMWYSFNGMSVIDQNNIDIVCMLNGTMSFRRSRRV